MHNLGLSATKMHSQIGNNNRKLKIWVTGWNGDGNMTSYAHV